MLGKIDMTWAMPDTSRIAHNIIKVWPQMPFFVRTEQTPQGEVTLYTVSTHQFTQAELRQMGVANAAPQPIGEAAGSPLPVAVARRAAGNWRAHLHLGLRVPAILSTGRRLPSEPFDKPVKIKGNCSG